MRATTFKTRNHQWRYLVIPVICLVMSHGIVYDKLPFQTGYQFPLAAFLIMLSVGFLTCEFNLWNHLRLKQQTPDQSLRNIILNVAMTTIFFLSLVLAINLILSGSIPPPNRMMTYLLIISLIATIETLIFHLLEPSKKKPNNTITNRSGKRIINIKPDQISAFESNDGLVYASLQNSEKIVTHYNSLKEVQKLLPKEVFYQVNRQLILNRRVIREIHKDQNNKLAVIISPDILRNGGDKISISRYKNPSFKKWFDVQ